MSSNHWDLDLEPKERHKNWKMCYDWYKLSVDKTDWQTQSRRFTKVPYYHRYSLIDCPCGHSNKQPLNFLIFHTIVISHRWIKISTFGISVKNSVFHQSRLIWWILTNRFVIFLRHIPQLCDAQWFLIDSRICCLQDSQDKLIHR